jgi:SAM-dependent methyltransferase
MRHDFNARRDIWGPLVAGEFQAIAGQLKNIEPFTDNDPAKRFPVQFRAKGLGPRFSLESPRFRTAPADSAPAGAVRRYFNEIAEDHAASMGDLYSRLLDAVTAVTVPYFAPTFRVLDAGCGPGHLLERLSRLVPFGEAVGIDIADKMLDQARQWLIEHRSTNTALRNSSITKLPEEFTDQFDAVLCFLSFGIFDNKEAALRELARVCANQGLLFIIEPDPGLAGRLWQERAGILLGQPRADRLSPQETVVLCAEAGFECIGIQRLLPEFTGLCGVRTMRTGKNKL